MDLSNPSYFNNRELSWLEFNERVLEEAFDKTNPLMERLKFLAITASNLDEFFMVRVSSLMIKTNTATDISGLIPQEALDLISKRVHLMVQRQYTCLTRSILPALEKEGIKFLTYDELNSAQKEQADNYWHETLYQILTPMAIDKSRPFPNINNRTVNIFIELTTDQNTPNVRTVEWLEDENRWIISNVRPAGQKFAIVQVPTVVPRMFELTGQTNKSFIFVENIINHHIEKLFLGSNVIRTSFLRVTRNSDLHIEEEVTEDLLNEMAKSVKGRRWGDPVRIEISKGFSRKALEFLSNILHLSEDMVYEINGQLDLTAWMGFASNSMFAKYQLKTVNPSPVHAFHNKRSMFDVIRNKDVLVHHPYMSFDSVVRFVQESSADPKVLAIKQTLYRVSGQSPIVHALIAAAENGKQVSVLVELKARFDEENNINWARLMEKSGVHVVYGLVGLKTHCKMCLVVRREDDAIRRYVHLGTGNYNEATAGFYTDFGLFTCREAFGQDSSVLFNVLTGYSQVTEWQKFAVAPLTLRNTFLRLIRNEINNALQGKESFIIAKMNSLSDGIIIQALYEASRAGVKINLLVRGICCLKPGIPDISENITVSSIVDRYLEHSRIFIFCNNKDMNAFLSSADWMERNLDRRVEVLFPIEDIDLKNDLYEKLKLSLNDNVKRREQQPDGTYKKVLRRGKVKIHSQIEHHNSLRNANNKLKFEIIEHLDSL